VGVRKDELFARISFLCSLLKFEFIPTGKEVRTERVSALISARVSPENYMSLAEQDYEQLLGWFIEKGLFQSKTPADHQHSLIFVPPHGERYRTLLECPHKC
jgi:hypothetical protein